MSNSSDNVLDTLDKICGNVSQFWRHSTPYSCLNHTGPNQTCHDEVDLTLCFEDTAILYFICLCLWFLAAVELVATRKNSNKRIALSVVNVSRIVLVFVPLLASLCDLVYSVYQGATGGEVAPFQYASPVFLAVSMVVIGALLLFERRYGVRSSGINFLFWTGMLIYGVLKLRSYIQTSQDYGEVQDVFRLTTFSVQLLMYLVEFILSFVPEPKPKRRLYQLGLDDERKPCPEETATFLSQITWWWQNGQIWHGWRRPLVYDDLVDLNSYDKSEVIAPKFQRHWNTELRKAGICFQQCPEQPAGRVSVLETEYQPVNASVNTVRVVSPQNNRRPSKKKEPSLVWALIKTFGWEFSVGGFYKIFQDLLLFASPQILKLLIGFTEDTDEPQWRGYFYAALLFVAAVFQSILAHQYFHSCFRVGMRIRTAVIASVYGKALRMSTKARRTSTVGEIVNLMSVDAQMFMDLMPYLHMIWSAPFQIVLALIFLWFSMGPSIFAGFAVMVLMVPLNAIIAAKGRQYQIKLMARKDSRIKLVNEVLNGIKVIKLYAWERPFKQLVEKIRDSELDVLLKSAFLNAATSFTWTCAPFLVSLATFATYALVNLNSTNPEDRLTADKVFVALSLFNILRYPLIMLPLLINFLIQASVSRKRLSNYLKNDELDPSAVTRRSTPASGGEDAISVDNGSFTWEDASKPTLEDLNLHVRRGELLAVVGVVGAGKSSLIQAVLGEMEKITGDVRINGTVAYVPQQAWIQNATVKDNILFGKAYNEPLYKATIKACALETDLEILPAGDQTEIGEKGINLSGGQKQRVSLARAVYQEADIYLLDDPLSAVDSHVGKHIFEQVIGPDGILKGKVRVLVTHGIGFLPQCDRVLSLEGGRVQEVGAYADLIDNDGPFAEFIRTHTSTEIEEGHPEFSEYGEFDDDLEEASHTEDTEMAADKTELHARKTAQKKFLARQRSMESGQRPESRKSVSHAELKRQLSKQLSRQQSIKEAEQEEAAGGLIKDEKAESGRVKLSVFVAYIKACTYYISMLVLLFVFLSNAASLGSNFWLADYSNKNDAAALGNNTTLGEDVGVFLGVYAALGFGQAIFVLIGAFCLAFGAYKASQTLHEKLIHSIMRSPMSFFDTTPLGRILNRFSKDVYIIDQTLPWTARMFLLMIFSVLSTIVVIVIATPIFLVVIVPLTIIYLLVQRVYVATSRQLKRLESISRSPIYTHFQESVTGAPSIRAYNTQERFIQESERRVDYNQIAYYPGVCANRWLAIRLEFLGNLVILFAALFAVLQRNYPDVFNLPISAGLVGLSISYALQVTTALNMMVRMTSDLETNIVAVERVKEYAETPNEAPAVIETSRPPDDWPQGGHVTFNHYATRYREGLDLVLKDIKCDVPSGTKIGIVGRTGAGKSSLTLALFRIIEPAGGAILIDGVDISSLGLEDLRSRITIIPQDPVLFSGDLRMNLDPFENYSDEQIWRALESAHLSSFVSSLEEKLQYSIAEGGENLSVGQRQLVCLARALLRKTKILVLDEATAAVDLETDDLIQKTIRSEFADCTVLTIAHRLNTIIDYDIIMVLDAGRIVEFDPPGDLLSDKNSVFHSMAADAGIVN